ncbi:ArsR/SmtB family transcription factor [Spirosoma fluminis]
MRDVFKALSNDVRLKILEWLKDPDLHFSALEKQHVHDVGICVGAIQKKAGLSPSTASTHLSILQRAGLVDATRLGQWTYYKRNEAAIRALAQQIAASL